MASLIEEGDIMGMVDVGPKKSTQRLAKARAFIELNVEITKKIKSNKMPKGNVLEAARIAGILAAKKTSNLIPLCHNIGLDCVSIDFIFKKQGIEIISCAKTIAKTGVEMEAMVAVSIAALTVYDMSKMFSKSIEISKVELLEKSGGRSGTYRKKC